MQTQADLAQHPPAKETASKASFPKLSPGPGLSASSVAADQRRRVLAALAQQIAERGYERVTIRGLTRLAGVSTSTFYKHFCDKDECHAALGSEGGAQLDPAETNAGTQAAQVAVSPARIPLLRRTVTLCSLAGVGPQSSRQQPAPDPSSEELALLTCLAEQGAAPLDQLASFFDLYVSDIANAVAACQRRLKSGPLLPVEKWTTPGSSDVGQLPRLKVEVPPAEASP